MTEDRKAEKVGKMWYRKSGISEIKWPITPLYSYQTKNQDHLGQSHIQPYHHIKFELNLFTTPYRHAWVSQLFCFLPPLKSHFINVPNLIRKCYQNLFLNHIFPTFWDFLSSVTARSSESFGLELIYKSYFMPKIQWINISIVNKLSFWSKYGVLLLQGVP